jgi:hypothetical protein
MTNNEQYIFSFEVIWEFEEDKDQIDKVTSNGFIIANSFKEATNILMESFGEKETLKITLEALAKSNFIVIENKSIFKQTEEEIKKIGFW